MIILAGARTDIAAFYSEWLYHRIQEGFVYVRNPYYPKQITCYQLKPDVVDCIVLCTKNPRPLFDILDVLQPFHPYVFVTVTPYGREIEPYAPHYHQVLRDVRHLSLKLGRQSVVLRYDPIFINHIYTIEKHIEVFDKMLCDLEGFIDECVISFIDLYAKTKRNFPGVKEVDTLTQMNIVKEFSKIASSRNIKLKTCGEKLDFSCFGVKPESCLHQSTLEKVIGCSLKGQKSLKSRPYCHCYPSHAIGQYNTCLHGCLYCYANENKQLVIDNYKRHDPMSPLLIGHVHHDDIIKQAKQKSDKDIQLSLDI